MKLSNKQRNRIEEYLTYGRVFPLSNDYETLETILNDGEILPSHKSILEDAEGRYKLSIEGDWEDENGCLISGKDLFKTYEGFVEQSVLFPKKKYEDVVTIGNKTYVWNGNTYDIVKK